MLPPLPTAAALLPVPAEATPLPSTAAPGMGPHPVDPPAPPYPKEGLPSLLREAEPKLDSPKTISAENERPPEPVSGKASPPVPVAPELRSWA